MTTTTKTKKTAKATPKKRTTTKKPKFPPMPPSANVVDIGGRDYVITPLDEYTEWLEDQELLPLVEERLKTIDTAIPFDEMMKRVAKRRKGK